MNPDWTEVVNSNSSLSVRTAMYDMHSFLGAHWGSSYFRNAAACHP